MSKTPTIAMIPSAYKSGKVYSVLPSDGSGDLNFARTSEATRVNQNGLIETVGSNVPRIDYTDGGCPKLLLEPQSRNLVTHSEDFTNASWTKTNATITSNAITSPKGDLTADELTENSSLSSHTLTFTTSITSGLNYTKSFFVKNNGRNWVQLAGGAGFASATGYVNFDIQNGLIGNKNNVVDYEIIKYGNGWYKISATFLASATASSGVLLALLDTNTPSRLPSYTGDGTSGVYLWGAQLEQGSYATSYIPTSGATATRNAETASKANISNLINSSEGVLYLNTAALADSGVSRNITIYQNTSNLIKFIYSSASNRVDFVAVSGGSLSCNLTKVLSNTIEFSKIALKWKTNDFALWINGVEEATDTSGNSPLGMDKLNFTNEIGTLPFYANVKDLRIYNKALTDAELKALTS